MMAEPEKIIIDAIVATGLFAKVRYLVAESDADDVVTSLPIFVLSDAGRDFTAALTFCGTGGFCIRNFEALILAETAEQARSLEQSCYTALLGIVNITSARASYDEDLGCFATELSLT